MIILGLTIACKSKDPSILKIYVRSSNNILTPDAKVRLVGDIGEGTPEFFKETTSNGSGEAFFNLDELFDKHDGENNDVAYFTLYAKDSADLYTTKKVRARVHLTSVETIYLEE